jgi:hypothetical protein
VFTHLDGLDPGVGSKRRDPINCDPATGRLIEPQFQNAFAIPDRPYPEGMNLLAHRGTSFVHGGCVSVIRPTFERE